MNQHTLHVLTFSHQLEEEEEEEVAEAVEEVHTPGPCDGAVAGAWGACLEGGVADAGTGGSAASREVAGAVDGN